MNRITKRPAGAVSLAVALLLTLSVGYFARPAVAQAASEPVMFLDQGWTQADREWYYQVSQGSTFMPYDMFMALEVAASQELFSSNANSERLGLITQPANPQWNPDGLPIGLAKWSGTGAWPAKGGEKQPVVEQIGLNCAGCHNSQLNYKGKRIRIDGGNGHSFDFMAYVRAIDDAMQATRKDAAKFDRLAARLKASSPEAKASLRERFETEAGHMNNYRTRYLVTPITWGPGRIDAISAIINRLTATLTEIPENASIAYAPTKIPFLWNAPQGLWTQWRGVQQDPIQRNMAESMGVFLYINLHAKSPAEGLFQSNSAVLNLQKIENQLGRLAPPSWPEEVLGKIDREKAKAGKALFVTTCAGCHNAWPYAWSEPNKQGKRYILVGLTPQSYVGTDPGQFEDVRPEAITAQLSDYLPPEYKGKTTMPTGELYFFLQKKIMDPAIAKLTFTPAEEQNLHGYRDFPLQAPAQGVYKAAPRDGVWATPPFMHNGSVPNLYEMLLPASERTKKFYIGREFDPVKVGVDTNDKSGFLLDTTLRGNSNAGHSFENAPRGKGVIGPLLTDDQRWALIEYLKSIPEVPGRVTPSGGPPAK